MKRTRVLVGSQWRDSNGHVLTVTHTGRDKESKRVLLYGTLSDCTCEGWWGHVHTSPDEFPDYHQGPHGYLEGDTRQKYIFGWERIS